MFTRRDFLRFSSASAVPAFSDSGDFSRQWLTADPALEPVFFMGDGPMYSPTEFIAKLGQINQTKPIERDFYGKGGCVDELASQFATITGKEAAIYLASGTLANQLAISVLSGENTKVFVQETSHVYRDEADAAQSVFGKRLISLAPNKAYFTLSDLQQSIEELNQGEVFRSGIGVVSIENPVRRNDGQFVPIDEIKKIAAFCREKGYKLHLDGARIYLAAAYSGTSVKEYASYFDTVYISLYKYLGAAGGAILCGPKEIIDKMEHLAKIHGGVAFMSWTNAAMALHHLAGLEERLKRSVLQGKQLAGQLNELPEIKITPVAGGTNISNAQLSPAIDPKKLSETLWQTHQIALPVAKADGSFKLMVNDSLLNRTNDQLVTAFKNAIRFAKR
ncbi:threonine aldolase family protein [Spirosoma validum]|uniref:Aminotransferase class I/II-fold pyridoxal phosphate-dependent enzyme n=1 Tax=Spirosoma validum TaxID=2771355 RepID=A0A927GDU3_9BACT|nr:aminotransferase class I/II-fold pyridoxal phosphate-dependent enzyme [Spirosoma validum]MBD2754089.1 aminotransferase class I/II-fold pyridoxal phosphate-dependent enzyme [Spirosoma validum]